MPTLERLRKKGVFETKRSCKPVVIVLVPTRELAMQVGKEFEKLKNGQNELTLRVSR